MANVGKACDVFIAHSAIDIPLARDISEAFRANDLNALTEGDLPPGKTFKVALLNALAECRAMILVLSPSGLSDTTMIEIGAIQQWKKPIYGIARDLPSTSVPSFLAGIALFTPNRIDEVNRAVRSEAMSLDTNDRLKLAGIYKEIGRPFDTMMIDPNVRRQLVKRFTAITRKTASEERLLSELVRMRKQGNLPQLRVAPATQKVKITLAGD